MIADAEPVRRIAGGAAFRRGRVLLAALTLIGLTAAVPAGSAIAAAGAAPSRLAGEIDGDGLRALIAARKGKVVLLNFWATWCVPCREEFPDLARLQKDLGPQGLAVVGVSTDFASQTAAVETFLGKLKPNFPNYRKKSGGDDQVFIEAVDRGWGGELPFSVLYGPDGGKAKVLSGKHTYAQYRGEILKALEASRKR